MRRQILGELKGRKERTISLLPTYEALKSSAGPDIAEFTGLVVIRSKCPHFDAWLCRLEALWK
jgi:hypothetical protein